MSFDLNIAHCHSCDNRQKICNGACLCLLDNEDIIDHAKSGKCPVNKFSSPPPLIEKPKEERRCNCTRKSTFH